MNTRLLLILNEGNRSEFINELCEAIRLRNKCEITLHFLAKSDVENQNIPAQFQFESKKYNGPIPIYNASEIKDESRFSAIVNLSNSKQSFPQFQHLPVIKSSFFSTLFLDFNSILFQDFILEKKHSEFKVYIQKQGENAIKLANGRFKILSYNYHKTLDLLRRANVHLLADAIHRFTHQQLEKMTNETFEFQIPTQDQIQTFNKKISRAKRKHRINQIFFHNKWNIGIIHAPIEEIALKKKTSFEVKWFNEAKGKNFYADPFGHEINGEKIIFFENYNGKKGILSAKKSNGATITSLQIPAHLSYPFTFSHRGKHYCLPEQNESEKLLLYQIHPETLALENGKVILENFKAVDPTLYHKDEKWYLFCTNAAQKGADLRLYIFIADTLEGPWRAHQKNPVKNDICSARPAGPLFEKDGILYRPAQDSSSVYGGEIVIHRIAILSESEFVETEINRIQPSQFTGNYTEGCHTISPLGTSTLIDAKRKVFTLRNLFQFIRKKQNE